jgi:dethiobiotin synthetase
MRDSNYDVCALTMKTCYFVTSTGTGVGKTYVTVSLIKQARVSGRSVMAFKPVVSGFDREKLFETDTGSLIEALSLEATPAVIDRLSPWRYAAPLAPSIAARREGRRIDFNELVAFTRQAAQTDCDVVLVEGVGGVMVPIDEAHTVLDWIEQAGMTVLMVVGSYLGTISHTLTALEAIRVRNVHVGAVVVNASPQSPLSLQETVEEIGRWTKAVPVIAMARESDGRELRAVLMPVTA